MWTAQLEFKSLSRPSRLDPRLRAGHPAPLLAGSVLVGVYSFVVERLSTGILFLLSLHHGWNLPAPDTIEEGPLRTTALKKRKLWNFGLSALLGGVVIAWYGNVRLLQAIGPPDAPPVLDIVFTGLLLTAGSERVAAIVKLPEGLGSGKKAEKPVQITGTLVLKEGSEKKLSTPA